MKDLGRIILHIPAREGSKRVPGKNMRLMNDKPMIAYAVEASIQSNISSNLYVNTDSFEIIKFITEAYPQFKIYKRDKSLADDKASSEDFNLDIIEKLSPDTLIMINPVCPLIEPSDIKNALDCYAASKCDTLITSNSTQMQTFCEGEPINMNVNEQLAPSQSNKLITTLNWAITIWDAKSFKSRMTNDGFASLGNKRVLFDINQINSFKVSEEKDFLFVNKLVKNRYLK
jgi:CMP-N,N'-diacetyllegionaminic acid synthase